MITVEQLSQMVDDEEAILYYDGPLIWTTNLDQDKYIWFWTDCGKHPTNDLNWTAYLLTQISPARLDLLLNTKLELRAILEHPEHEIYRIIYSTIRKTTTLIRIELAAISEIELPRPECYIPMHVDGPTT